MLPSSVASKPSSANSSTRAAAFVAALKSAGDTPALLAIRDALPWSFIGLVVGLVIFLVWLRSLSAAELPAFGVMAFVLAVLLADRLAQRLNASRAIFAGATFAAFVLALPRHVSFGDPVGSLHLIGESGLLLAIVVALAVAGCACALRRAFPSTRIAPAIGAAVVVAAAAWLFAAHVSLGDALIGALAPLGALGDSYGALLAVVVVETLLWLVGVHGPAMLAAIVTPVYLTLQAANTAAYAAHAPLPHIVVVSLFLFVFPGGAGATLPLCAMLCFSRVARVRTVARVAIVPAIFNINEPLLFGLPVAFNPYLAVPFVLTPVVLATITYAAVAHGVVARAWTYVPSSIPTVAATYLATFDWRAVLLALANIAIAAVLYAPFVRLYEKHAGAAVPS